MSTFEEADMFAELVHTGQFRHRGDDKGKPYIIHPRRMASRTDDPILKKALVLHDTLEDGIINGRRVFVSDLVDVGIEDEVIEILVDLTRLPGETYFDFIMRVMKNPKSSEAKMFDLEDNMASLDEGALKDKYRLAYFILKNRERL